MKTSLKQQISNQKRLLCNPYAFLEYFEESHAIHAARKLSENPHALTEYLETEEITSKPKSIQSATDPKDRYPRVSRTKTAVNIEQKAIDLQIELWKQRHKLFPDIDAITPINVLQPAAALRLLGYELETADALGQLFESGRPIEVAGLIDSKSKKVLVSGRYSPTIRHFTAAHELGHAVLHDFHGMHRDKPLDSRSGNRSIEEVEADKFAAFFLMPRKLVTHEFERRFGQAPFMLNEASEFALAGSGSNTFGRMSARQIAKTLASAPRFNGVNITPLNIQFSVSIEAMAIRLEELNLVTKV